MDWVAGNIDAVDLPVCNQDAEPEWELCKRVSEFKSGESQTAKTILTSIRMAIVIVMVLDPKSVDSVADLMQRCAEKLASHYVPAYLARKGESMEATVSSRALISPVAIRRVAVRDAFRSGPFRRKASENVTRGSFRDAYPQRQ